MVPNHLPGAAAPSTTAVAQAGSRDLLVPNPSHPQTPVDVPASQSGSAQHGIRDTRNTRRVPHGRCSPVAPVGLESSDLTNIDLSQLQVESDSSDSDYRAARRAANGSSHTRAISNPFPSLFLPKRKKATQDDLHHGSGDLVLNDNGSLLLSSPKVGHQSRSGHRPPAVLAGRGPSFSTGPCITCGSLMRWARDATAFRCGICLTVNDLATTQKPPAGAQEDTLKSNETADCSPISIEKTQYLIAECLESYLEAVLQDVSVDTRNRSEAEAQARPCCFPRRDQCSNTTVHSHTQPSVPPFESVSHCDPILATSHRSQCTGKAPAKEKTLSVHPPLISSQCDRHPKPINPTMVSPNDILRERPPPSSFARKQIGGRKGEGERHAKRIFQPLEDYLVSRLVSVENLDSSFVFSPRRGQTSVAKTELLEAAVKPQTHRRREVSSSVNIGIEFSPVTHHHQARKQPEKDTGRRRGQRGKSRSNDASSHESSRSMDIDWAAVNKWYSMILNAGASWESIYTKLVDKGTCAPQPYLLLQEVESHILKGQQHVQRVLMKCIETVLKRPGRRIGELGDFRFLLIALANPLLQVSYKLFTGNFQRPEDSQVYTASVSLDPRQGSGPASGQHSVIIKRILGLISNSSNDWQSRITTCFARYPRAQFLQTKDTVSSFLAYRLIRHNKKKDEPKAAEISDPLIPKVPEGASAASFHAALNQSTGPAKKVHNQTEKKIRHDDDWQIKAAVRVLGLLFAANFSAPDLQTFTSCGGNANTIRFGWARHRGQILPTSDFYITLLDNCDLVSDFERWEQQETKFSFCQYPFLLSVWTKIQILEYDARRQMKNKARDAFFDSIMTSRNFDQHLLLNVRRNCLVEDSLKGVSAAIGSGTGDIKKGLRITFNGEEGIDAGGLRKEWFLLLVREVFNPDHGMFAYDEESQYCYFNPASFETSDQFFLVGVVLGLAIYNSTILDIALPPFAFRKLLLASPVVTTGLLASPARPSMKYTLADLAEYRPRLARGLQQLLDHDGDVQSTFSLDFSITAERFGQTNTVPLCPGGELLPVTNSNREEYVDMYVRYLLDISVARQFDPFKRGFFTVCGCNALGLFRPEEIELLVKGSDEPLDVASLSLAASYENWPSANPLDEEPTIKWFWQIFSEASSNDQRRLLVFITGSDRIPATGPASLSIRILYLGNDTGRYPTARTCFNILTLYRYASKAAMATKLWGAVYGSEGFGLK